MSLDTASLYAELLDENQQRRLAEKALRESRATLLLEEQINRSGSWTWDLDRAGLQEIAAQSQRAGANRTGAACYSDYRSEFDARKRESGCIVVDGDEAVRNGFVNLLDSEGYAVLAYDSAADFRHSHLEDSGARRGTPADYLDPQQIVCRARSGSGKILTFDQTGGFHASLYRSRTAGLYRAGSQRQ